MLPEKFQWKGSQSPQSMTIRSGIKIVVAALICLLVLNHSTFIPESSKWQDVSSRISDPFSHSEPVDSSARALEELPESAAYPGGSHQYIPNIVHYVQLLPHTKPQIRFSFKQFLAIYGASVHLNPDKIYIHTNVNASTIARLQSPHEPKDWWTKAVLAIPHLQFNYVTYPEVAAVSGVEIKRIEHKSDFVRMEQLYEKGGVYMDTDVHPLRDFKDLRESGFGNVVGREIHYQVNNGVFMCRPRTALLDIWMREAHRIYDGGWTTASCKLLTAIAERLMGAPREVLIMDRVAFNPVSWYKNDKTEMYSPHLNAEASTSDYTEVPESAVTDPYARWKQGKTAADWQLDLSTSYAVHATKEGPLVENFDNDFSPKYVFERQSSFARAIWPTAKLAKDAGWILDEHLQ
ncbi:hypothetical protein RBB50_000705 [Rhinocladiella similis]